MKPPRRPRVGLTARHELNTPFVTLTRTYVDAVVRAGGAPIVLPIIPIAGLDADALVESLDALILTGGEDITPLHYRAHPHPALGEASWERDEFELALAQRFLASGKPLLGICRGMQLLNVIAGGSLVQDLPSCWPGAMRHGNKGPKDNLSHAVSVAPGSLLARLMEQEGELLVNTLHHQAIEQLGQGYTISAKAADGVVEAIEAADGSPVLGVQWHPEELEQHAVLFRNFVALVAKTSAAD